MKQLMIMLVTMMLVASCGKKEETANTKPEVKKQVEDSKTLDQVVDETVKKVEEEVTPLKEEVIKKIEERKVETSAPVSHMKDSVWVCDTCGETHTSYNAPSGIMCPQRNRMPHKWTEVGKEGSDTYICENCNCKVKVSYSPQTSKCPNSTTHRWKQMY